MRGHVFAPGDPDFAEAGHVFNPRFDHIGPAAVGRPVDELWAYALSVLDAYAVGAPAPEPSRRGAFWKR